MPRGCLRTSCPLQKAHTNRVVSRDRECRPILEGKSKDLDSTGLPGKGPFLSCSGQIPQAVFQNREQYITLWYNQICVTILCPELFYCFFSLVPSCVFCSQPMRMKKIYVLCCIEATTALHSPNKHFRVCEMFPSSTSRSHTYNPEVKKAVS